MSLHPETGAVWEGEHGPQGGDEINLLKPGTIMVGRLFHTVSIMTAPHLQILPHWLVWNSPCTTGLLLLLLAE